MWILLTTTDTVTTYDVIIKFSQWVFDTQNLRRFCTQEASALSSSIRSLWSPDPGAGGGWWLCWECCGWWNDGGDEDWSANAWLTNALFHLFLHFSPCTGRGTLAFCTLVGERLIGQSQLQLHYLLRSNGPSTDMLLLLIWQPLWSEWYWLFGIL